MKYDKPEEYRKEILKYFAERPYVLIGQVAMMAKCSLIEAEKYLMSLEREGLIRLMTAQEARQHGVKHCYSSVPPI